jgi:hypothetical protein
MRKSTFTALPERLANAVAGLLELPERNDYGHMWALCPLCDQSWRLWADEDSQFAHVHRCTRGSKARPEFVIRVSIERIGKTPAERVDRVIARNRALRGGK